MHSKLFFIPLFVFILFSSIGAKAQNSNSLSLEKIWNSREYAAKGIPGFASMNNGKSYTMLDFNKETKNTDLIQYNYETGTKEKVIIEGNNLKNAKGDKVTIESYDFSADESKVLIQTNQEAIYRHSFVAEFYVYNLVSKSLTPVASSKIMHATFSPDGKKVAYLKENNLWYYNIETAKTTQVTSDGERNKIINGSCDWVYEEEFAFTRAYQWSPNSDIIGYYRFDESKVREFSMAMYGELYPSEYRYKYPKSGEANSEVSVLFYNLATSKTVSFDFGNAKDFYVPRLKWSNQNQFALVYFLNRLQNELTVYKADVTTGKGVVLLNEKNKYYIDINDDLSFTSDGKNFIWSSERDGFSHLYLYAENGKLINQITKGSWDVDALVAVDPKKKVIYYTSSEVSPMERHLYAIGFDGRNKTKLTTKNGFHYITFNTDNSLYIDNCSDINTPAVITLHKSNGKQVRELENNKDLNKKLEELKLTKAEFFTFKNSAGTQLNGWMIKPAAFDATKKYPVLMFVYGGPGSQTVVDRWGGANYLWYQYLSQKGYVVVSIDNRGTGFRGEEFKKCTYLELGKKETEDQLDGAGYLGSLPYIDQTRIGIFGWSYGGYMSSLCITKGADKFKTAVAVAPVTNWRYYDNIYTERYMRTPQENGKNYDINSPLSHADKLKGKYLIIHGTADDNVHFQNSVEMVNALIKAGKNFDSEYYPNKNHGIGGGNTRLHVFSRITDFILQNL